MIHDYEEAEARVLQLENIEAIRRLKCEFATRLDGMVNDAGAEQPLLDCFSENAVWESEHFGCYMGHAGLSEFLTTYRSKISFSLNFMLNQIITVETSGLVAVGRWTTWSPMTFDGKAMLLAGRYVDGYVLIDGHWKIASTQLHVKFISDYKKGWAEERFTKSFDFNQPNAGARPDVA